MLGNEGMRVRIQLKPNKKANYTAYQNITVRIGKDKYKYSEAWTLNTSKTQYDTFSVPEELRDQTYRSTAEMWIEKGGVDKSYQKGKLYSADTPWGMTKGRMKMRKVPPGTKVTRRMRRVGRVPVHLRGRLERRELRHAIATTATAA